MIFKFIINIRFVFFISQHVSVSKGLLHGCNKVMLMEFFMSVRELESFENGPQVFLLYTRDYVLYDVRVYTVLCTCVYLQCRFVYFTICKCELYNVRVFTVQCTCLYSKMYVGMYCTMLVCVLYNSCVCTMFLNQAAEFFFFPKQDGVRKQATTIKKIHFLIDLRLIKPQGALFL